TQCYKSGSSPVIYTISGDMSVIRFLVPVFVLMLGGLCAQSPIVRRIDFSPVDSLLQAENEQPVVINFWATWCRPCVKELPYFAELKAPIRVILISLDFGEKTEEKLQKFISERGLNHIHWWL